MIKYIIKYKELYILVKQILDQKYILILNIYVHDYTYVQ